MIHSVRLFFALLHADHWICIVFGHVPAWLEPVENGPRCRHCDKPLSKEARYGE